MLKKLIFILLLINLIANETLACNGYKVRIVKMENCAGADAVMTFDEDFSVKLNKKCEIVPSGCVINKAFTTAEAQYKIVKDGATVKEGKIDMCSLANHADRQIQDYLKLFGAPASCPVEQGKVCGNDNRLDVSKYKSLLSMARGHIVIDSSFEHDTGKSCIHIELDITKK